MVKNLANSNNGNVLPHGGNEADKTRAARGCLGVEDVPHVWKRFYLVPLLVLASPAREGQEGGDGDQEQCYLDDPAI